MSHQNPPTELGDYLICQTLGKGAFGKVKLGIHKPTNQHVAIKFLNKRKITDMADIERVRREIYIMKFVRHPNVIQLYELIETESYVMMVMEYMERGELFQHIVRSKVLEEGEACAYFHQLINAIEYIHKLKFAHRDIKLQNLLLDYTGTLKLVDFGLSNTYPSDQLLKTSCGSRQYAAPQLLSLQPYNGLKSDLWSSGIVLYTMLCGCLPFQSDSHREFTKKLESGRFQITSTMSHQAEDLLKRILQPNPLIRYNIEQIRKHPWMRKEKEKSKIISEGIVVGCNRVPVEGRVVERMVGMGYDGGRVRKEVEANRHNGITAAYYLLLKKLEKQGVDSPCSLSSKNFDISLIAPIQRSSREPSHSLTLIQELLQQQQLRPVTASLTLKPSKPCRNSEELDVGKENMPCDVNRKRSKSKGYINKPPPKLNTKIEEMCRSKDLVTPANRTSLHCRQQSDKNMISKSRDRKMSKSTKKTQRQRISSYMQPADGRPRLSGCNTTTHPSTTQMIDLSTLIHNANRHPHPRQRTSSRQASVSKHLQINESLNLHTIVEKYYTHHRA